MFARSNPACRWEALCEGSRKRYFIVKKMQTISVIYLLDR
jgi:hypothetical protein